jgi:hypothetical protein
VPSIIVPELSRGGIDRRRERARGLHVERPLEPHLREHLPARVHEHRELHARVVDEARERLRPPTPR